MTLRLQPVRVATDSEDAEGLLVFARGNLVAVLVRLSDDQSDDTGKWFLEAGFGSIYRSRPPVFYDLDKAQEWITISLAADN
ncbi:hypothetical protein IPV08_14230 [Methylobacterium sp. SD274]|uniref:hypothetical protein n=1 Tax=Methylobacterium sp. SD274 TaxID=2782009 RepID=UPI001A967D6C|nr:hypothetical protein [Methylobacterium sp. SD274]MBO1021127.1 hypothetical protein [Methylobacterium sp. SD274]